MTRSTIPDGATSGEIDALVRTAGAHGESTFHLDAGALRATAPDVILGQSLCRVCAVTLDALPAALPTRPAMVPLDAASFEGVFADIERVALALGVPDRGAALITGLRGRLDVVERRVEGEPRPRVACLEWLDPLFCGGHWVPEQVALAGGIDVLGAPGERSRVVGWHEVVAAAPDVLVAMPCGFSIERAEADLAPLVERDGWDALAAVREDQVFITDGAAFFSRPGPRLVDGVEILASFLHPKVVLPVDPSAGRRFTAVGAMSIARAVVTAHADLAAAAAEQRPKAWGALAARGVLAYRERLGRPLTERERREVWAALWRGVRADKAASIRFDN